MGTESEARSKNFRRRKGRRSHCGKYARKEPFPNPFSCIVGQQTPCERKIRNACTALVERNAGVQSEEGKSGNRIFQGETRMFEAVKGCCYLTEASDSLRGRVETSSFSARRSSNDDYTAAPASGVPLSISAPSFFGGSKISKVRGADAGKISGKLGRRGKSVSSQEAREIKVRLQRFSSGGRRGARSRRRKRFRQPQRRALRSGRTVLIKLNFPITNRDSPVTV